MENLDFGAGHHKMCKVHTIDEQTWGKETSEVMEGNRQVLERLSWSSYPEISALFSTLR